jgi:quinoprotein dehydrogenase-associated probable ABC transporter substrate-binding protein
MSSAIKCVATLLFGAAGLISWAAAPPLRVCADPNNLPYSNDKQQGFENRIADLIASDFGTQVTYFWFPQREKFFRNTLNSGACDVVIGVPTGLDEAATTQPYYRSTYVFVSRSDLHLGLTSLDDPRLRTLKIGVHILGEQDDSLPPVHALISRGIVKNLVGFSIFGNLYEKDPPADLIKAVAKAQVDVAIAWGPVAGYFAKNSAVPLDIAPVGTDPAHPDLPFAFNIGIGVREGDTALKQKLDAELVRRHAEIQAILQSYGIPVTEPSEQVAREQED